MVEDGRGEAGRSFPGVIYDFDPNNLPPEYLQAIGLVAMASASTDSVVGQFIGGLLKIDNIEALALTAHLNAPVMDHIARALIELNATDVRYVDEVDRLLDAVNEAQAKRNTILHNSLCIHPETGKVFSHRLKARGSLTLELQPISVDEILADAREIHLAGMAVQSFMAMFDADPILRNRPIHEPLNRTKKAREERSAPAARPAAKVAPDKAE